MRILPVTFKVGGQQIVGILHLPSRRRNAPVVILCHGWSGNRLGSWNAFFVRAARALSKSGFAVLRFDFRGSGDSDGVFENQTITSMLQDLTQILKQIRRFGNVDGNKIALIGHSQGGYVSLLKAPTDKRIKCIILWMGRVSDLKDFWAKTTFEELHRRGFLIWYDYKTTKRYVTDGFKYNSAKAMTKIRIPVGMIYGDADTIVYPSEGTKVLRCVRGKKELKIIPSLDHDFTGEKAKKEVIKLTAGWLKKWLR